VKRHHLRRTATAIGAAGVLIVLGACGSTSSDATSSTPSQPSSSSGTSSAKPVITIKSFKFSGPSSVKPGATVTVTNEDSVAHTVTADDSSGGFDVKVDANSTATFTAPSKAGDYAYHCTYHSNMHGTLTVG
jgi:plastocyanin